MKSQMKAKYFELISFISLLALWLLSNVAFAVGQFSNLSVRPIEGGFELSARVRAERIMDALEISLGIGLLVRDPSGNVFKAHADSLPPFYIREHGQYLMNPGDRAFDENGTTIKYLSDQEFEITRQFQYRDLNQEVQQHYPNVAIQPGSRLFLHITWPNTSPVHFWGLNSRGGGFVAPTPLQTLGENESMASQASNMSPLTLDHALEIDQAMVEEFNITDRGLKLGGQIHSRLESEGKYQVGIHELPYLVNRLFSLSTDVNPNSLDHIPGLGPDWELKVMDKYLVRDRDGAIVLTNGFPTVYPMVDTYYDHPDWLASQSDAAIRYRYTEHNGIGNWNIKPSGGVLHQNPSEGHYTGIVDRLEYGLDVTDSRPQSIMAFSDSDHNANPFKILKDQVIRLHPQYKTTLYASSFLEPSLKLTTYRYKFILKNRVTGLEIEVSVDDVWALALRSSQRRAVRFVQVEMDIEHVAAVVNNRAQAVAAPSQITFESGGAVMIDGRQLAIQSNPRGRGTQLMALHFFPSSRGYTFESILDGSSKLMLPGLHRMDTLSAKSPLRQAVASTLDPAATAIEALRNLLMDLNPYTIAPPKSALASALLYQHRLSAGVQSIQYEVDDPNSKMFDFQVGEIPQPNSFACSLFLGRGM